MRVIIALVAILAATAVAHPTKQLEDAEATQVRKSRDIGVNFAVAGSFGSSPYQYYPEYRSYYRPYYNYPGTYYESYGRPYYDRYYESYQPWEYNGASIGFGFGGRIDNDYFY